MRIELKPSDFLYCYDINLHKKLKANGIKYLIKSRALMNDEVFTMYYKSPEVIAILEEWESNHWSNKEKTLAHTFPNK